MRLASVHTTQLNDPTTGIDGLNCTAALGAAAVKWRYRNVRPTPDPEFLWLPTGGYVRSLCRVAGEPDTEGGTTLLQVQDAVLRGWQVDLEVVTDGAFADGWELGRDPDILVIWQFQYAVISGTPLACSDTFRGPHASGSSRHVDGYADWSDPLADGRRPNIPKGVQRIARDTLAIACAQLVVNPKTGKRRGAGRANYAWVRALPEPEPQPDGGDVMFNVGPTSTFRDAVLKAGTVLYRDAALTVRQSAVTNETPLGFLGSTAKAHVVVNAGNSNYVKRADVARIVFNERTFE